MPSDAGGGRAVAERTVADVSERDLVARIQERLPSPPPWLVVGIGDDAAVVEPARNRLDVLTVDAIVEGVHFDRRFTPPAAIGHRALAVNLSDLAAMGAAPRLALVSLALPERLPLADFDALIGGLVALAARERVHVVGGNLTRSPGPLVVDITATGTVKRRGVLTRAGARPGDALYVSGTIGAAAAGLLLLRDGLLPADSRLSDDSPLTDADSRLTDDSRLATGYCFPSPRVRLGVLVSRNRAATACMDLSDGLGDAVRQVAEGSGVGAVVDAGTLPIDPAARRVFESRGADAVNAAVGGGDDYELLLAVGPRRRRAF